jgi:hypothetical protein
MQGQNSQIQIIAVKNGEEFVSAGYSVASITAKVIDADGSPVRDMPVTWRVLAVQNNSQAMRAGWHGKKTGLTWGDRPTTAKGKYESVTGMLRNRRVGRNRSCTDMNGEITVYLTDIVGERIVSVEVSIDAEGISTMAIQKLSFGNGPLSLFCRPFEVTWHEAYFMANGREYSGGTDFKTGWKRDVHVGGEKMPSPGEIAAVSFSSSWGREHGQNGYGAAYAAGWPGGFYWTGEAAHKNYASIVLLGIGASAMGSLDSGYYFAQLK